MDRITQYQRECWESYKSAIELPDNYTYYYGNPVKVHVPVETATHGLMIVGAYPTAHFHTIDGIPDVPVADHLYPFSSEKYFDGSRVRPVNSGEELEGHYLKPLRWTRDKCWITDLVKVFLFKGGHVERYCKLGKNNTMATRQQFSQYARKSLDFLYREIELAQPLAILLLGVEVTSVVLGCSETKAVELMTPSAINKEINGVDYIFFPLPHPGIVMRNSERGKYWQHKLRSEFLPNLEKHLEKFVN
ncbi:MAG: uracil-DNA glycosylase family protein [bacterium]